MQGWQVHTGGVRSDRRKHTFGASLEACETSVCGSCVGKGMRLICSCLSTSCFLLTVPAVFFPRLVAYRYAFTHTAAAIYKCSVRRHSICTFLSTRLMTVVCCLCRQHVTRHCAALGFHDLAGYNCCYLCDCLFFLYQDFTALCSPRAVKQDIFQMFSFVWLLLASKQQVWITYLPIMTTAVFQKGEIAQNRLHFSFWVERLHIQNHWNNCQGKKEHKKPRDCTGYRTSGTMSMSAFSELIEVA